MISRNHSNRRSHNWLIYDIGDLFLQKNTSHYKGVLYDLGSGESPYSDFFLQYAETYIAVDWSGSFHATKADIAADLNKPLPIESEVADTVVSLSVLEHLCEPQMMLNEAFRILKPGGRLCCKYLGNGGYMKRRMTSSATRHTGSSTCLKRRAL